MINRNGPTPTNQYLNFGKIFIWGSEVTAEIFPMKDLSFGIGYTYTNATDESPNTPTSRVLYTPSGKVDLSAKYLIPKIDVQTDLTGSYLTRMYTYLPTTASPSTRFLEDGRLFHRGREDIEGLLLPISRAISWSRTSSTRTTRSRSDSQHRAGCFSQE